MPDQQTRPYHSPQRREQARRTEQRIVQAAARLLVDRGWTATTLADVARAADISPAMLYKVFRTKADLAKRVYDVAVVGDQEPVPFRERPEFRAVLEATDPHAKLYGYAHLIRGLAERVLPIYEQLRAALTTGDAELREFADTVDAERLIGARGIVEDLRGVADLDSGLDEERAVDLVWTTMSPEYWALLVNRRSWSWDDTEDWVGQHLCTVLLGSPDPTA
ncbi:MAG: helix-turn-helix domain-containing protein [Dermatophilaceae bacterium]